MTYGNVCACDRQVARPQKRQVAAAGSEHVQHSICLPPFRQTPMPRRTCVATRRTVWSYPGSSPSMLDGVERRDRVSQGHVSPARVLRRPAWFRNDSTECGMHPPVGGGPLSASLSFFNSHEIVVNERPRSSPDAAAPIPKVFVAAT